MLNLRKIFAIANEEFVRLQPFTSEPLDLVNVGLEAGDGTGDTVEEAIIKVIRNFSKAVTGT